MKKNERTETFVLFVLWFFGGLLGMHRFYAGKRWTGFLFVFTLGGFLVWNLIDGIMILTGNFFDKEGWAYEW